MATAARARQADYSVIWEAQPKQAAFISCPADDVGFGGARGGGKSDAVPGDFISHEDLYGKDAIGMAFRRERTQLTELIERAKAIMVPLGWKWHEQDKFFRGPKGGRLRFTYLDSDSDADAYQGMSFTRLYPEEMGTFPSEAPINKLQATLRSGNGVPCQMKATCNPGGPGHQWVKARYKLDSHPGGYEIFKFTFTNPFNRKTVEKTRVFIPSKVVDNRYLGDDYVANLFQVGSPQLVRAWLEGDWSIVEGAFFPEWSTEQHVIPPFTIPAHWTRFRSADWGSARPFSIGWWAVVGDDGFAPSVKYRSYAHDHMAGLAGGYADGRYAGAGMGQSARGFSNGDVGLDQRRAVVQMQPSSLPRGALVRYREWYGSSSPNVGLKYTAEQVAAGILEREINEPRDIKGETGITHGVLDPSAFAEDGGPSIAERMAAAGVLFRRADNARVARQGALGGWDQVRARLVGTAQRRQDGSIDWSTGRPMIYVFSTCRDLIRTLPALQHDATKAEDVDTESEDHAPDDMRYACMSRPYVTDAQPLEPVKVLGIGPHNTVTLDDLWEAMPRRRTGERI